MNLRLWPVLGLMLVLTALPLSQAQAGAENGASVSFHYQSDTMDDTNGDHDHTAGIGLGIDFQFAIAGIISINPMAWYSFQPSGLFSNTYGEQFLGVEARVWINNIFVGAHVGQYQQHRSDFLGLGNSETGDGIGVGYTVGYEGDEGGFIAAHWDEPTIDFSTISTDMKGYKIIFGKRFH